MNIILLLHLFAAIVQTNGMPSFISKAKVLNALLNEGDELLSVEKVEESQHLENINEKMLDEKKTAVNRDSKWTNSKDGKPMGTLTPNKEQDDSKDVAKSGNTMKNVKISENGLNSNNKKEFQASNELLSMNMVEEKESTMESNEDIPHKLDASFDLNKDMKRNGEILNYFDIVSGDLIEVFEASEEMTVEANDFEDDISLDVNDIKSTVEGLASVFGFELPGSKQLDIDPLSESFIMKRKKRKADKDGSFAYGAWYPDNSDEYETREIEKYKAPSRPRDSPNPDGKVKTYSYEYE